MKLSTRNKFAICTSAIALVISFAALPYLPPYLAIHLTPAGQAGNFTPKWVAAFLMPLLLLLYPFSFTLAERLLTPDEKERYAATATLGSAIVAGNCLLLLLHGAILASGVGMAIDIPRFAAGSIGLSMALIGNFFGKTHSNFFIGVRNHWTLSNEKVLRQTHRITALLFVVEGIGLMLATLFAGNGSPVLLPALIVTMVLTILAIYSLSYFLWRREQ